MINCQRPMYRLCGVGLEPSHVPFDNLNTKMKIIRHKLDHYPGNVLNTLYLNSLFNSCIVNSLNVCF